jgi:hypothetical protein
VSVTIPFTLLTGSAVPTITKLAHGCWTFTGTFRSAHINVIGPAKEHTHITHAEQTITALAVGITITLFIIAGSTKCTIVVVPFIDWTVLATIWIDRSQTYIHISWI